MSKKVEPSDQVRFLVACIKHSSNGKPEFGAVAEELGIVSKAAAQKRYERMLKAHSVSKPGAEKPELDAPSDETEGIPKKPAKRKTANGAGAARKKLKTEIEPEVKTEVEPEADQSSIKDMAKIVKPRTRKAPAKKFARGVDEDILEDNPFTDAPEPAACDAEI